MAVAESDFERWVCRACVPGHVVVPRIAARAFWCPESPRQMECSVDSPSDRELYPGLAAPLGYRYADHVGEELFVAGQVPHDAEGELVGIGDAGVQARQCLRNLVTLVTLRGFSIGDIHHLTIYVVGEHQNRLDSWGVVTEFFDGDVPPATLLGVAGLGYEHQLVEIDARVTRG
jgi:enamine deaminase RidA (YjgF/YER057c/UK114 family)